MLKNSTESAEDRLIARYFRPLAKHPGALGLVDDAAVITPPAGCDLVLTTDGVISGVHYFPDDRPENIGRKALRMNLSDLAAKGAAPLGFLLSLALQYGCAFETIKHALTRNQDSTPQSLIGEVVDRIEVEARA